MPNANLSPAGLKANDLMRPILYTTVVLFRLATDGGPQRTKSVSKDAAIFPLFDQSMILYSISFIGMRKKNMKLMASVQELKMTSIT